MCIRDRWWRAPWPRPRYRQVRLEVQARTEDRVLLEKLVTVAERACIVANTLRGGVDLRSGWFDPGPPMG